MIVAADSGLGIAAEWFAAVAAGAAFIVTALGLRQERRARHAAEDRAGRQHARLLLVSIEGVAVSTDNHATDTAVWAWVIIIKNQSAEVFDDVELHVETTAGNVAEEAFGMLAAGARVESELITEELSKSAARAFPVDPYGHPAVVERPPNPRAMVRYTDEAGTRWERDVVTTAVTRIDPAE